MEKLFYVYIVASSSRVLYTGVTSDIDRRMWQHRNVAYEGFSKRYRCTRLVWYGDLHYCAPAIAREKQIKGWLRAKKVALIERQNPTWEDLAEVVFATKADPSSRP